MVELKLMALEKEVNPVVNAPTTMAMKGVSLVAGDVNYIDVTTGNQGIVPTFQVQMNLQNIGFEIQNVSQRIREFFYNDLFLSILQEDKRMSATEVVERHEEKLLMLGSVIERIQSEMLDIIIDRVFNVMYRKRRIPEPPPELLGMDLKIEYISLLAQAQKVVGVTGIQQLAGFVGSLAAINPEVIDKFDYDQAVDEYADMVGTPPKIVRSDDAVADIRKNRQQLQQQQMAMEQANMAAQGAKTLSDTKTDENSMLNMLLGTNTK